MKQILAVEDNEFNLEFLQITLEAMGYICDGAINGRDALEILKNKQYDLILMDCQMPELDGYDTTLEIRKLDKITPIIALSATLEDKDIEHCLKVGMNDFLIKPIDTDILGQVMEKYIKNIQPVTKSEKNSLKEDDSVAHLIKNLEENMGFTEEQATYFIKGFIEEFIKIMGNINEAIKVQNHSEIRNLLHQLKGVASNMRVAKVSNLAKEL